MQKNTSEQQAFSVVLDRIAALLEAGKVQEKDPFPEDVVDIGDDEDGPPEE